MLKLIVLSMFLLSCGNSIPDRVTVDTPPESTEETQSGEKPAATAPASKSTEKNTSEESSTLTPVGEVSTISGAVASPQIKYVARRKISGVGSIFSATKIGETFYFTGTNTRGFRIFGTFKENLDTVLLKTFADMDGMGFKLPSEDLSLTTGSAEIELSDARQRAIFIIDPDTLTISQSFQTECAHQSTYKSVFIYAEIRMRIFVDTLLGCGMDGGDTVVERDIVAADTNMPPTWLATNSFPQYGFDNPEFYQYDLQAKTLIRFNEKFEKTAQYSTSGYAYNQEASVIMENGENIWFFGCDFAECYFTIAKIPH